MGAVILFEFPAEKTLARQWILDRAALLTLEGKAELKFVGTEVDRSGGAGAGTVALEFANIDHARMTLSEWRRDAEFPGLTEVRLLETESLTFAGTIFP